LSFILKEKREKVSIKDRVSLEHYKREQDFQGEIHLVAEDVESGFISSKKEINSAFKPLDERTPLDDIVSKVNELFQSRPCFIGKPISLFFDRTRS